MIFTQNVLNTVAAAGADLTTDGDNVFITGAPEMNAGLSTFSFTKDVYAAATLGNLDVDLAAAIGNSTTYSFTFEQVVNGQKNTVLFSYTTDASGTEAELCNAITDAFAKYNAVGYTDVTVAAAGGPALPVNFQGTSTNPVITIIPTAGGVTVDSVAAAKTDGAKAVNLGSQLQAAGLADCNATGEYTTYKFNFQSASNVGIGGSQISQDRQHVLAIDENAANAGTLITDIDAALAAAS